MDEQTVKEMIEFKGATNQTLGDHNIRIMRLERRTDTINELALSVKELAVTMKTMLAEQQYQHKRLERLEQNPLETWSTLKKTVITSVVSLAIGAIISAISFAVSHAF